MQCRSGARIRRIFFVGLAPLLTAWIVGCPLEDTGGDAGNPPADTGNGSTGQPVPTPDAQIEVTIDPAASGTVTQTSSGNIVTLTAIPADGWAFSTWFDSTNSTQNPLTIQVNADTSIGARFTLLQVDSDGDGVPDGIDKCPGADDRIDTDRDGVPNGCDQCDGQDDRNDQDGDGNPDGCDDCPNDNPDDTDADGVCDSDDVCPGHDDAVDADNDDLPDGCDDCPNDDNNDEDDDGVCGDVDICPGTPAGTIVDEVGCPRPDNDLCANAQDVSDGETPFDTERASTDDLGSSPTCSADASNSVINDPTNDTWFCYTATCNGLATADLCDGNFDTVLAVYDGCVCPPTNLITCGDDECGTRSKATLEVTEGSTYLVRIGGFNDVGTGTLSIDCDDSCTSSADCSDGNPCTDDICDSATGECSNPNNSDPCSDGNPCTIGDVCSGGGCASGSAPDCSNASDQCNLATCSPSGSPGNCDTPIPLTDGTTCDDHNVCNLGESCQSGSCTGGNAPDCSTAGDQCNVAECGPAGPEGNCDTLVPVIDGTSCDNGMACAIDDSCQSGVCQGGDPPDCATFGDQCNTATCDPTGAEGNCDTLVPVTDGTLCEDGVFCTGSDSCLDGSCSEHTGDPCPPGLVCSVQTDTCVECVNFGHCEDGLSCTQDVCENNVCGFNPIHGNCADDDLCTIDVCDLVNGCENPPVECSDNEFCNPANGDCEPMRCISAEDCNDGDACTDDACVLDFCEYTAVICDNELFCDGLETCDIVLGCQNGIPPCDDSVACTDDVCDELAAEPCTNTANDANCDDGLFCNGAETCDPEQDCLTGSNPCPPGQTCDEIGDNCVGVPTSWSSTQLLRPNTAVFAPPETYHLDSVGQLTVADLGITAETLAAAYPNADQITLEDSSVVPGVTTLLFTVVTNLGAGDTTTLDLTIDTFKLSIRTEGEALVATWTFDYVFFTQTSDIVFGISQQTKRYAGTQSGDVSTDGRTINWTAASGIVQTCDLLTQQPCTGICLPNNTCGGLNHGQACSMHSDCDVQLSSANFPVGIWTQP